ERRDTGFNEGVRADVVSRRTKRVNVCPARQAREIEAGIEHVFVRGRARHRGTKGSRVRRDQRYVARLLHGRRDTGPLAALLKRRDSTDDAELSAGLGEIERETGARRCATANARRREESTERALPADEVLRSNIAVRTREYLAPRVVRR